MLRSGSLSLLSRLILKKTLLHCRNMERNRRLAFEVQFFSHNSIGDALIQNFVQLSTETLIAMIPESLKTRSDSDDQTNYTWKDADLSQMQNLKLFAIRIRRDNPHFNRTGQINRLKGNFRVSEKSKSSSSPKMFANFYSLKMPLSARAVQRTRLGFSVLLFQTLDFKPLNPNARKFEMNGILVVFLVIHTPPAFALLKSNFDAKFTTPALFASPTELNFHQK